MKGSEEGGDVSRLSLTGWWIASFIIGTTSVLRVLPRGRIMAQPGLLSLTAHPTHDFRVKKREKQDGFLLYNYSPSYFFLFANFSKQKHWEKELYLWTQRELWRHWKEDPAPTLSQALWPSLKCCWSLTCFFSRPVATTLDGRAHFRTHT